MVVDYSQTINQYTQLDAYSLPRIEDQVNEIAKNSVFSTIDLKDAYYKIPIQEDDQKYYAFEAAACKLYQRKRLPFGVTNGVPCFQRIDNFIAKHEVEKTFALLDVTACRKNMEEHDKNLRKLLEKDNMKLNHGKSIFFATTICLLRYQTSNHEIKPDPACLKAFRNMPPPPGINVKSYGAIFLFFEMNQ